MIFSNFARTILGFAETVDSRRVHVFTGMLIYAWSGLVFHFTVFFSSVWSAVTVTCPLCICVIFPFT
jgi:hypothetical protein